MDFLGFYTGKIFDAYEFLGAHEQGRGTTFRTFAPAANGVTVMGEFSGWNEIPMNKIHDGNFWECHVQNAGPGMMYKYCIYDRNNNRVEHCDPYGFGMELRPEFASIIRDMKKFTFKDGKWMKNRTDRKNESLNIYEIHFGSFKKPSNEPDAWYKYDELADLLIPYLKENGYNYVEIMPLNEYPCDESWGYQATGFFSPTSRYGTMDQFKRFVDRCHQNNIGIIMDFVPVHFAVDYYGLTKYDGTYLYEYPNDAVGVSEWGSCNFMHSRGEVRSFLQSCVRYWLELYHVDGIRMDAISRIIYWQGDQARGVNQDGVKFLQYMNGEMKRMYPSAILIAEDSTAYPGVTKSVNENGLGFDYKWDMGWMNDTLNYFKTAPEYRTDNYHKLTFSMMYYYNDRYLLPLSHDEVVHGKGTIIQKMSGDYDDKFPQAKTLYMYMYTHPGKKLNFMGNEIGQFREWDEKREQDWLLMDYPKHQEFAEYMKALNEMYMNHSAFYSLDYEKYGFEWIDCHQETRSIFVFQRNSVDEKIAVIFNMSDIEQKDYCFDVTEAVRLEPIISTEERKYGGTINELAKIQRKEDGFFHLHLERYSGVVFKIC